MSASAFPKSRATLRPTRAAALMVALALALGGCSARPTAADPSRPSPSEEAAGGEAGAEAAPTASIAVVHRRKCGGCHTRVEPGSLPRATIEAAMARHRRRAKLTEDQWAAMIEFLSRAAPAESHHTASLPSGQP